MPTALIAEDEPLLAAALRADLARLWPDLLIVAQVADGLSAHRQALALQPQVSAHAHRQVGALAIATRRGRERRGGGSAGADASRPVHGFHQARLSHRLDQVVHRLGLEGLQRVPVIGGDEHQQRE